MNDKKLTVYSLVVALVGLTMLAFLVLTLQPKELKISEIDDRLSGTEVVVKGTITSFSSKDGNVFLTLDDGEKISVVMFSREAGKQSFVYDLQEGDFISVEGEVQLYKNELEIVAAKIG